MKKTIESLEAWYHPVEGDGIYLGKMGVSSRGRIALEVGDPRILATLAPLTMKPRDLRVVFPSYDEDQEKAFHGLFGLFADSLPDSFGMATVQNKLMEAGYATGPMETLAYLGGWGRGAISYVPSLDPKGSGVSINIEELFDESIRVQEGESIDLSDPMAHAMGTTGGTRPKAFVVKTGNGGYRTLRGMTSGLRPGESSWMLKFDCTGYFRGRIDNETRIEAAYLCAAREAGIEVPEFEGIEVEDRFHLALKRFDRTASGGPVHVQTLWGLLQAPTGSEYATYDYFAKAGAEITRDLSTGEQIFRRAAFNVLSGNMDDHPKQHAFLYDGNRWSLAPAYDLTYNQRRIGHFMPVHDSVKPGREVLLAFADEFDVRNGERVLDSVSEGVRMIPGFLEEYDVPRMQIKSIEDYIDSILKEIEGRGSQKI